MPDSVKERRDRGLVLSGRLQVLQELLALTEQLGDRISIGAGDDVNLPVLVDNWREIHRWMEQATEEVKTEIKLLRTD